METVIQNVWSKTKVLVKAIIIGGIILVLQLPTFYVRELVDEREQRQKDAIAEVSSKWAKKQTITGPILVLPYREAGDSTNKNFTRQFAYFLPDVLNVKSNIAPEEKYRGIYKVMLYASKNNLSGSFSSVSLEKLKIAPENVLWNEAFVQLCISDAKGLNDELKIKWNNQLLNLSKDEISGAPTTEILSSLLNLSGINDIRRIEFSTDLNLNGSEQLLFTPVGKSTAVDMSAKWPHPSFTGDILPLNSRIDNDSFFAKWKSVSQKRNFPQQWKNNAYVISYLKPASSDVYTVNNNIATSAFGADLYIPVSSYQKTMRSVKYAALCMLLTFAAFFLIETTNRKSVHPFQYGLIGVALVLFYTLLLSISEYIGFNLAYVIASIATIGLISWFVKGILTTSRLTIILSAVLALMYTYVFTILQLQDYSLLLGSIGLFITLAIIMHFSKKIQW